MIRIALAAFLLVGCDHKKKEDPAATPPPAQQQPAQPAPPPPAAPDAAPAPQAVDVPTTTDFEDQASKDITDKNVEAKVKAMEAELGQ